MHLYNIAGVTVGVTGGYLNHIPGFSIFSSERKEKADIVIKMGEPVFDLKAKLLYSFNFEERPCEFSYADSTYLFKMVQSDDRHLLTAMHLQNDMMSVTTNMCERTPMHHLRFAIWLAFGIFAVCRQTVSIHASTVIYKGKTILFLGESGTGKSTQTHLWLKHINGTELLNDDSPFVYADENKAIAFGSPWSGKTDCFRNIQTPISCLIRLSRAPHNKIKKLEGLSAIGALLPSCPPAFAYDEFLSDKVCNILSCLLRHVPVYSLECLPDEEAVRLTFSTLINDGHI